METCQWNRKAPVGIIGWLRLEGALRIITPHGAQPQGRHSSVFSPQLAANHFRGSFMHSCSLAISPLTQSVNCSQAVRAMPDRLICSENPNPPRAPLHLSVTDSKCFFCPPIPPPGFSANLLSFQLGSSWTSLPKSIVMISQIFLRVAKACASLHAFLYLVLFNLIVQSC